jgi:hypothetical protein
LVNLWLFIAVRNSLTISGLWCLHGVFDMYFNVYNGNIPEAEAGGS